MENSQKSNTGSIVLLVRIKTRLTEEEMIRKAREREPEFAAIPGIIQKYYIRISEGEFGGVYLWDTEASLKEYRASDLAATIASAYEATEAPRVERFDIMFALRD